MIVNNHGGNWNNLPLLLMPFSFFGVMNVFWPTVGADLIVGLMFIFPTNGWKASDFDFFWLVITTPLRKSKVDWMKTYDGFVKFIIRSLRPYNISLTKYNFSLIIKGFWLILISFPFGGHTIWVSVPFHIECIEMNYKKLIATEIDKFPIHFLTAHSYYLTSTDCNILMHWKIV